MPQPLLLDTHIFLWMRADPAKLLPNERLWIDQAPCRLVSIVTFWEVAILINLGRIEADQRLFTVPQGVELLPIRPEHCQDLAGLPQLHRDPFDRMLIAQARIEGLLLLTRDTKIINYGPAGASIAGAL